MAFSALKPIPEHEAIILIAEADAMTLNLANLKLNQLFFLSSVWRCSHPDCTAYPYSKGAIFCRLVQRPLWILILILGVLNLLTVAWQCLLYLLVNDIELFVFPGERPSMFSNWSTHFMTPVRCHSHNDYWRRIPLQSALAAGCISVEADVWSWGDELLVGHSRYTVLPGTLHSLYLDPLLKILDDHNAPSRTWPRVKTHGIAGVFANDPMQTLTLLVDFKTDGDQIWPLLTERLQSFRDKGYLTYFNGTDIIYRPVTVVANGDAPFNLITKSSTYRDIFYDAPLDNLTLPASPMGPTYNPSNSYYASADFRKSIGTLPLSRLSDDQLSTLRRQVRAAHDLGLKVRYWGNPTWPVGLRNYVWNMLVQEGVDVINTDDLRGTARQDWTSHHWWKW